jgi:hypothetical protein
VALKADSNLYLGRCRGCAEGVVSPDFAMVYATDFRASAWARWDLEDAGNGKVALKSDLPGYYLTQCRNCIPSANYPDSVAVMAVVPTRPAAQWTLVDLNNGKFAIRGNNQKYLARCLDCFPSSRTGRIRRCPLGPVEHRAVPDLVSDREDYENSSCVVL